MARPKNILETVTLTIATNQPLVDQLECLVSSGMFGKSSAEAAERLIAKGVLELQREGQLISGKGKKTKKQPVSSGFK